MEVKWSSKALSDLARLYTFLAPVNKSAAARTVQSLTLAPNTLLANSRIGEQLDEFLPREINLHREFSVPLFRQLSLREPQRLGWQRQ